jgi:4-hydroxy-3-methylbut-2-en-1-yl diphosphate synthase IspG/GcpE
MLHAFTYLSKYGYNSCQNQSELNDDIGKTLRCLSNVKSMIKKFQTNYRLLLSRNHNQNIFKLINPPRCGVENGPLSFMAENRW